MNVVITCGGTGGHITPALAIADMLSENIARVQITFIGTEGAVILGMIYDFLPYMVLPIYNSVTKLDKRYIEAANDLGCNNVQTLFKVVLPLTVPGIVSGVTMVFVPSISTFYISQKLGGGSFDLIGDTIERQFQNAITYHTGAAVSLVMMVLILISMAIMNKFSDGKYKGLQVYYSSNNIESLSIANKIRKNTRLYLQVDNKREVKRAESSIYILNNIKCPSVLVECGFLSNESDLSNLKDGDYQMKLSLMLFCSLMESVDNK